MAITLPKDVADWISRLEAEGHSNKGKLNIYTCKTCRGHVVTRDLADGVTPFMQRPGARA